MASSGARLPRLVPDSLGPEQRALRDELAELDASAGGAAAFPIVGADGALNGPFNAMLLGPVVGRAMQGLGAAIRHDTTLGDRIRELAILLVAARERSAYITYAHERVGRQLGLTAEELAQATAGRVPTLTDASERCAMEMVEALLADGDLDDSGYATAVAVLGERAIFELTAVVGYYRLLALQVRVFGVVAP